jgi:hypothetical protein
MVITHMNILLLRMTQDDLTVKALLQALRRIHHHITVNNQTLQHPHWLIFLSQLTHYQKVFPSLSILKDSFNSRMVADLNTRVEMARTQVR